MTTQTNREIVVPINPNAGTTTTRVRDFTRMNPPEFHGSKVEKDPQKFTNELYKVLMIMGVTPVEKAEFAAYQLKGVSQVWFNQLKEERGLMRVLLIGKSLRFSGQCSSNSRPRFNKDMVSNPKPQGENGGGFSLSTCAKCGKKHEGKCLADTDGCFGCGKCCHKIRDFPSLMAKGREGRQALPSCSGSSSPKQNKFYAL
ncbi:uncharacterized protein LOC125837430 [Solanum verrucosum]|uniref:uncharacterized protein LOC125837430 n=1 Tax=Solanum verrucosum TaxID=315347 RepID=UPI0020D162C9|nr:uncharacterized protein LOC125837430 [Solanum verrucosum]